MFDLDTCLPSALLGDSLRLQQVLINLAGNALKFTLAGQVVISVEQLMRTENAVCLRFSVSDTGIGISQEQLLRIFEGFTQAEASTSRRFGGTGLGLVICRRLVSLMGGELHVESQLGVGSRFWFDLTLGVEQSSLLRSSCPGVDVPTRLLVVDDNLVSGELLLRTVHALGWKADLVNGGTQAVEWVKSAQVQGEPYDVVLMDWRMSDMDGLRAAQLIHQQDNDLPPPMIIMITAYGREVLADIHQEGDAPFVGFLTKPVTPKQLADAVQQAFNTEGALYSTPSKSIDVRSKRLAGLRLLVVEDNAINRQVADELLTSEGAQVTLADGGLEGVSKVESERVLFDAVLMDIQMPDIDGLEATRRIRSNSRFTKLPIVAMTANASSADRDACLVAGMNDHVGKPIDLEQLIVTLLSQTGRVSPPKALSLQRVSDNNPIESHASIIARFGGDVDLIRNVLRNFGPELERQLNRLADYIEQQDTSGVIFVLHAINGSSGTMGAKGLSSFSAHLEDQLKYGSADSILEILSNTMWLDELRVLLKQFVDQMNIDFGFFEQTDIVVEVEVMDPLQWKAAMEEILRLLEAGNLQAIELADALVSKTPRLLRPRFDELIAMVHSLDFAAAIPAGREIMESL